VVGSNSVALIDLLQLVVQQQIIISLYFRKYKVVSSCWVGKEEVDVLVAFSSSL
jgi:hypothetical protein